MSGLNRQVDVDGTALIDVARGFLQDQGLIE